MENLELVFFTIHYVIALCSLGNTVHGVTATATPFSSSCNQTPYGAESCRKIVAASNPEFFGFREMAIRASIAQARKAHHQLLSAMAKHSSLQARAQLAWADCLDLSEDTLDQLDSALSPNLSPPETQTLLSASITNHQTCFDGFSDLNLSSSVITDSFPALTLSDLPRSLSNSLAIINNAVSSTSAGPLGEERTMRRGGRRHVRRQQKKGQTVVGYAVVAWDGTGDYETISEAVAAVGKQKRKEEERVVIHVKAGVYHENVEIERSMKNLMFVGEGIGATVVSSDRNNGDGYTTFRSATFATSGDGFIAQNMTFRNTAGPRKQQAVALRCSADRAVFHSCSFEGYQDTLYVHSKRQFYRDCHIYGTVDFIFGDAAAVFQNCDIYVRKGLHEQQNTVTAQGRSDPNSNTGIVIHESRIMAAVPNDAGVGGHVIKAYLGRPWKKYSRTVIMKTFLDDLIAPEGWAEWNGDFALSTLYYGEYMNMGRGADTKGRVKWPGYHIIKTGKAAAEFTIRDFLDGDSWIPATGVPYADRL